MFLLEEKFREFDSVKSCLNVEFDHFLVQDQYFVLLSFSQFRWTNLREKKTNENRSNFDVRFFTGTRRIDRIEQSLIFIRETTKEKLEFVSLRRCFAIFKRTYQKHERVFQWLWSKNRDVVLN